MKSVMMNDTFIKPIFISIEDEKIQQSMGRKKILSLVLLLLSGFITLTAFLFLVSFMTNLKADYEIILHKFHNSLEAIEERIWSNGSHNVEKNEKDSSEEIIDFTTEHSPIPEREDIPEKHIMNLFSHLHTNIEKPNSDSVKLNAEKPKVIIPSDQKVQPFISDFFGPTFFDDLFSNTFNGRDKPFKMNEKIKEEPPFLFNINTQNVLPKHEQIDAVPHNDKESDSLGNNKKNVEDTKVIINFNNAQELSPQEEEDIPIQNIMKIISKFQSEIENQNIFDSAFSGKEIESEPDIYDMFDHGQSNAGFERVYVNNENNENQNEDDNQEFFNLFEKIMNDDDEYSDYF